MAEKKKVGNQVLTQAAISKKYAGAGLASSISLNNESSLWLPSRILPLNYMLGGGIKYGSIMELFGEESTGKSLMMKDFGKSAQALGGEILWNDAEGTFAPAWAEKNGLDLSKIHLLPEAAIEIVADWQADMIYTLRNRLTKNEPILLVNDSIGAYDSLENFDNSIQDSKAEMGNRAKAIYTMLRRRNRYYVQMGICVCFINQLRQKLGASKWEDPDTTVGGNAMKFFASQRVALYRGKQIKNADDERVGNVVYIRTKKNKVAPPKPNIQGKVFFTEDEGKLGYDPYAGLGELLEKVGIIENKRTHYYYEGKQIAHGERRLERVIAKDKELRQKLIKDLGVNTISKTRKQIEKISRNLYPLKIKIKKNAEETEGE